MATWRVGAIVVLCALVVSSCRSSFSALADGSRSTARAEEMFGALAARVTDPVRDKEFSAARAKLYAAAMIPSRVFKDSSVWTSATTSRRTLLVGGRFEDGRYRLHLLRSAPLLTQPADSRHLVNLTRLADNEYAWDTEVPFAIGTITARQVGALTAALLSSAEGRTEADVRADYRAAAPRAAAIVGRLFTIDSIRTTTFDDRSTAAVFVITMNPAGVEAQYPHFAAYLRRYSMTARARWTLTDHAGVSYLDAAAANGRLVLKVRTLDGALVALDGPAPPRTLPDSLMLNGELAMKVRRFTVGFRDYHAEFTLVRTDHERAINVVSRTEPRWDLPLITERLIRTPLRRPFQGRGAQFRLGVRDSTGAQTLLTRRVHLEVQESAILRFLGRLGATAFSDYQGDAEREQLAWLREVFAALVADVSRDPSGGSREP